MLVSSCSMKEGADEQISTSSGRYRSSSDALGTTAVCISGSRILRRVLRDAVTERPVFLLHFHQPDEDILTPHFQFGGKSIGDRLVQRLLLIDRTALVEEDLDVDEVAGAVDAEI